MKIDETMLRYGSIQEAQERLNRQQTGQTDASSPKQPFEAIFNQELAKTETISFSKHAGQRMAQRDIELSAQDIEKLGQAVKKAEEKGVRNTLILFNSNAFIVNVPANTVITAMTGSDLKENVFTQIDGAVIL